MSTKKIFMIALISLVIILVIVGIIVSVFVFGNDKDKEEVKESFFYDVEGMTCNLKESNRYAKVDIMIEVYDKDLPGEMDTKNFLIKDSINKIIRNKEAKDLAGSQGQTLLQNEITKQLINVFGNEEIVNVYFEELIIQ